MAKIMECLEEAAILGWLEGQLDPKAQSDADAHIDGCDECLALIAVLGRSDDESRKPSRFDKSGRYELGGQIGTGGMGKVYSAHDSVLDREVAIKVVRDPVSPSLLDRLRREMHLSARLQHPSIVPIYDAGQSELGDPFFVMHRIDGIPLSSWIQEHGDFGERLARLPVAVDIADAMHYAHEQGVLHRDLKPQNIMLGSHGETFVVDWGLAVDQHADALEHSGDAKTHPAYPELIPRAKGSQGAEQTLDTLRPRARGSKPGGENTPPSLTATGHIVGSLAYMSPEQARGDALDERSDVYAIGGILYELFSAHPPHEGKDGKRQGRPTPIRERCPKLPAELCAIVDKSLAEDIDERYQSAAELAGDLRKFQAGRIVSAHDYSLWELSRRWLSKHRALVVVSAVALLAVAATIGIAFQRTLAAKAIAEEERARSEEQRKGAEKIVEYSLTNLRGRLETLGRLDILEGIAAEIESYYEAMPLRPGRAGADDLNRQSRAFGLLGDVKRSSGELEEASRYYKRSLSLASRALELATSDDSYEAMCLAKIRSGDVEMHRQDYPKVVELNRECLDIAREHKSEEGNWKSLQAQAWLTIAQAQRKAGKDEEFLAALEQAKPLAVEAIAGEKLLSSNKRRMAIMVYDQLASYFAEHGEAQKADENFSLMLDLVLNMDAKDNDAEYQEELSLAYGGAARGRLLVNDIEGALELNAKALEHSRKLAMRDPSNLNWQKIHANHVDHRGHIAYAKDDMDMAFEAFKEGVEIARRLPALAPDSQELRRDLAASELNIAMLYLQTNELDLAEEHYVEARRVFEELLAKSPDVPSRQYELSIVYRHMAQLEHLKGNSAESIDHSKRAIELLEKLHASEQSLHSRVSLAGALIAMAQSSRSQEDLDRARELLAPLADQRENNIEVSGAYDELDEVQAQLDKTAGASKGTN